MNSETDLAWAAGIIDGEGCIYIRRTPASQQAGCVTDRFFMGLRVVMGHEAAIRRLHSMFQVGSCYELDQRGYNRAWSYMVCSLKAVPVIIAVQPYLMVKAEEADVALEFMSLPRHRPGGRGGCRFPLPPELLAKKIELWERMRDLKPSSRFRREKANAR